MPRLWRRSVPRPDPATPDNAESAYVFERAIPSPDRTSTNFIDLYNRGYFVLEAKQGAATSLQSATEDRAFGERATTRLAWGKGR